MPPRTMLPPNLNRHFYEARRLAALGGGRELPPWWRLGAEERKAVEAELNLFRQAIRASEEEQDLVGSHNAARPTAAAGTERTAAETPTEPEACSECSAVAAIIQALRKGFESRGMTVSGPPPGAPAPLPVSIVPLDARRWGIPLSEEEKARLEAFANEAAGPTIVTAGIDPAILEGRAPRGPSVHLVEIGPTEASQVQETPREVTREDVLRWYRDVVEEGDRPEPLVVGFDREPIRLSETLTFEVENFRYNPRLVEKLWPQV